ncbi:MAG: alpha/beta hydrolase [Pseudomonadota bacterium]
MGEALFIRVQSNIIPEGMAVEYIDAKDGAHLRLASWLHPKPKGVFLIHPGWAEFIEKYVEVAKDLHGRGFSVFILDPRGQGYSQRYEKEDERGLIRHFNQFQDDLETAYQLIKERSVGPRFVLAHSMGGLITLEWLARGGGDDLKGVVVVAPLTRLFGAPIKRVLVHAVTRIFMVLGLGKRHLSAAPEHSMNFETTVLTQDRQRHERFQELQTKAPDAMAGSPRFCWLYAAMGGMRRVNRPKALGAIKGPVLLVSNEWDETVDPKSHRKIASMYPDIFDYVPIEGARHEVLMEKDEYRDQFWSAFDRYIAERLSG